MTTARPRVRFIRAVNYTNAQCVDCTFTVGGPEAVTRARKHAADNPGHLVRGSQVTTTEWWAEP